MRYFITLAYKGTQYHGWQVQANAHSVQEALQHAFGLLLKRSVEITGSGRTDTGVHALEQVAHFDSETAVDEKQLTHQLNGLLPKDIVIHRIDKVRQEAHARFDATERSYQYVITSKKDPFGDELTYFFKKEVDVDLMNKAAKKLIGKKDFQSFSKVKTEVNTFICEIKEAFWKTENEKLVFCVTANRFLRGMVRALVGTLLEVGLGKSSVAAFAEIIESKDRRKAGRAVPPEGLFLTAVRYPENIYL